MERRCCCRTNKKKNIGLSIRRELRGRVKMPKSKRNRRSNSASGYIGVYSSGKKYEAQIRDGKMKGLGTYDTAKQAAKAYDAAAIELGRPLS